MLFRSILNIIGGVLVGIGFDVGGPSFCKAGGAEKISDVGGSCLAGTGNIP